MPPSKLQKLKTFKANENLAIFDSVEELNDNIKKLIDTTKSLKSDSISVSNLSDVKTDLTPLEANFEALKGSIEEVVGAIEAMPHDKKMDMSGVETLLKKIASKKDTKVDMSELKNVSSILDDVLFAVRTLASKSGEKREELLPEFKNLHDVLNLVNENIASISLPDFDYEKFAELIKDNRRVGGMGPAIVGIKNVGGDGVNPATEESVIGVKPLSGASTNGTVALAVADTWYQVPSTVPTSDYLLVVTIENGVGDIRWSTENGGTPGVTNGNLAPGELNIKLAANEVLYYGSSTAGDDVNLLTKIL